MDCTHKEVPISDPCIKGKKTKGITTCAEVDYIKGISSTHIGAYICTRKEYMQAHTCIRTRIRTFLHNPGCHNLAHDALQQTIQALSLDFVASLMNVLHVNADGFCDDGNNNAYCTWDGGDCCGVSGQPKQYDYWSVLRWHDTIPGVILD